MTTKWWLSSTTVKGALVAVLPTIVLILRGFGVDIAIGEQDQIVDGLVSIVGLFGTIYTIIGRFKATETLRVSRESHE